MELSIDRRSENRFDMSAIPKYADFPLLTLKKFVFLPNQLLYISLKNLLFEYIVITFGTQFS